MILCWSCAGTRWRFALSVLLGKSDAVASVSASGKLPLGVLPAGSTGEAPGQAVRWSLGSCSRGGGLGAQSPGPVPPARSPARCPRHVGARARGRHCRAPPPATQEAVFKSLPSGSQSEARGRGSPRGSHGELH